MATITARRHPAAFDIEVLQSDRPRRRRLLGGLVRTVPHGHPRTREARRGVRRRRQGRQGRRRRQPRGRPPLRHPGHPDHRPVPRRSRPSPTASEPNPERPSKPTSASPPPDRHRCPRTNAHGPLPRRRRRATRTHPRPAQGHPRHVGRLRGDASTARPWPTVRCRRRIKELDGTRRRGREALRRLRRLPRPEPPPRPAPPRPKSPKPSASPC